MTGRSTLPPPVAAVGVVIPVRDEAEHLETCLDAVATAAAAVIDSGIGVHVITVLDGCVDTSAEVAASWSARSSGPPRGPQLTVLSIDAGNVGEARAAGCDHLLESAGRIPANRLWLATTDADSRVPPDWLTHQIRRRASGADAWVGIVEVNDTGVHPSRHLQAFTDRYRRWSGPHHPHVHGANLGFSAEAYSRAGGFGSLTTGEDHDMVRRLTATGSVVVRGVDAAVVTSDRLRGRAPDGFAGALASPLSASDGRPPTFTVPER